MSAADEDGRMLAAMQDQHTCLGIAMATFADELRESMYRYYPAEDVCAHLAVEVRRLSVIQDGRVVGGADVLWCPGCAQPVGPAPVEPLLWDGEQA